MTDHLLLKVMVYVLVNLEDHVQFLPIGICSMVLYAEYYCPVVVCINSLYCVCIC